MRRKAFMRRWEDMEGQRERNKNYQIRVLDFSIIK